MIAPSTLRNTRSPEKKPEKEWIAKKVVNLVIKEGKKQKSGHKR